MYLMYVNFILKKLKIIIEWWVGRGGDEIRKV